MKNLNQKTMLRINKMGFNPFFIMKD